jgi:5'-nucleotidase
MPVDLTHFLVIGISSRALFDLEEANALFESEGLDAYTRYQIENEHKILHPGTGFPLVQAILNLNSKVPGKRKVEVVVMSRNNAATSLRILNSIEHYKLDITRSAWSGGNSLVPYLDPFRVDLFLSANETDVQEAINSGVAAGKIYHQGQPVDPVSQQIRIAFDGDAVLFGEESERIYQLDGLEAFLAHEKQNARSPLPEGPFAKLLRTISYVQSEFDAFTAPIRLGLITARNGAATERVIRTLNQWKVRIDEAFFLGGMEKQEILKAFGAHIFFDDQDVHCQRSAAVVPTARVPYRKSAQLGPIKVPKSLPAHVIDYVPPTEEPPPPLMPDSSAEVGSFHDEGSRPEGKEFSGLGKSPEGVLKSSLPQTPEMEEGIG